MSRNFQSIDQLTLPKVLYERARQTGNRVALREKDYGIWNEITWREYYEHVKRFALGLLSLGFTSGDRILILGDNKPEWIYAELATQALGGIPVGVYQDALPDEIAYIFQQSGAKFVVAENQEQVDKILDHIERFVGLKKIIYYDEKGMFRYKHPLLISFDDVETLGGKELEKNTDLFEKMIHQGKAEDTCIICYTSGTTGKPKGAMLSHQNLLNMAHNLATIDPMSEKDEFLSFLPMAWVGEQMMSVAFSLYAGFKVNFPEDTSTIQQNIREIGPYVIFAPPRIWEDFHSKVLVQIEDSTRLKKWVYKSLMKLGYEITEQKFSKKPLSITQKVLYFIGELFLYSAIRDHIGLSRIKRIYTGGAAIGPDVFKFYHTIGVNIKQIYGQTEVAGIAVVHRDDDIRVDTLGQPIPKTFVKISEEGEILIKSESVFKGYWNLPEATANTITDGWLHTGDAGYIDDDGHLVFVDRLKEVIRLENGVLISPQFIENKIKFSPYIKEAAVIGNQRPFLVSIINIDLENVGKWAEKHLIPYTTYTDLSQKPEVMDLIRREVEKANAELDEFSRVKRFVLLYKEFDPDDDEMTRTRKIRRQFIEQKYHSIIEAMYNDERLIAIHDRIKYRDGRVGELSIHLQIISTEVS